MVDTVPLVSSSDLEGSSIGALQLSAEEFAISGRLKWRFSVFFRHFQTIETSKNLAYLEVIEVSESSVVCECNAPALFSIVVVSENTLIIYD